MLTIKTRFLIGGVVLCCLGWMCMPLGYGASPKRDTSLISDFADLGAFKHTGIVLLCAGVLVIVLTLLIPSLVRFIRRLTKPPARNNSPARSDSTHP